MNRRQSLVNATAGATLTAASLPGTGADALAPPFRHRARRNTEGHYHLFVGVQERSFPAGKRF